MINFFSSLILVMLDKYVVDTFIDTNELLLGNCVEEEEAKKKYYFSTRTNFFTNENIFLFVFPPDNNVISFEDSIDTQSSLPTSYLVIIATVAALGILGAMIAV